jgi:hypothetical protein
MRKKKTKPKKTKRNSLVLLFGILFLVSCQVGDQVRLRIEMPRKSPINLENYNEIIVTNFLVKEEAKDFDINKELDIYFVAELGQNLDKKVSSYKIAIENNEIFENQDFWKGLFPGQKGAILFTGNVEYTQEIRKAIKSAEKRRFESPFPDESRIEERRFYSLSLQVFLIDTQSGEALYKRTFKENQSYQNPNQTAYFAFYDLMMTVKDKLFHQVLGEEQIQERYLIK